jgi:hypothetical protein
VNGSAARPASGDMRDVHRGGVPDGEHRSTTALPLVWSVQLYQRTLSPLLGPVCRYYPSCSAYSVTALERYGPVRGLWLTVRRLGRCHPWAAGGVDHVPARPAPPHTHDDPSAPAADAAHLPASRARRLP